MALLPFTPGYQPDYSIADKVYGAGASAFNYLRNRPRPSDPWFKPQAELANPDKPQSIDLVQRRSGSETRELNRDIGAPQTSADRMRALSSSAQNGLTSGAPPTPVNPTITKPVTTLQTLLDKYGNGNANYMKSPNSVVQARTNPNVVQGGDQQQQTQGRPQVGAPGYVDYSGFHAINSAPTYSGPGGTFESAGGPGSLANAQAERAARFGDENIVGGQRTFNVLQTPQSVMQQRILNAPM